MMNSPCARVLNGDLATECCWCASDQLGPQDKTHKTRQTVGLYCGMFCLLRTANLDAASILLPLARAPESMVCSIVQLPTYAPYVLAARDKSC